MTELAESRTNTAVHSFHNKTSFGVTTRNQVKRKAKNKQKKRQTMAAAEERGGGGGALEK